MFSVLSLRQQRLIPTSGLRKHEIIYPNISLGLRSIRSISIPRTYIDVVSATATAAPLFLSSFPFKYPSQTQTQNVISSCRFGARAFPFNAFRVLPDIGAQLSTMALFPRLMLDILFVVVFSDSHRFRVIFFLSHAIAAHSSRLGSAQLRSTQLVSMCSFAR